MPARPGAAVSNSAAPNRLGEPLSDLLQRVAPSWRDLVDSWRTTAVARALVERIDARRVEGATIFPALPLRALALTARESIRVVIVGQDPYHGPGQAEGLAFSVPEAVPAPPSLRNILEELQRDLGLTQRPGVSLAGWAEQGVLLLNTCLTVEAGMPGSHSGWGWEALTDAVIESLSQSCQPIVFMLWGAHAAAKRQLFDRSATSAQADHCVLVANHPSPLSARRGSLPFIGCGHFGQARAFLAAQDPGRPPIDWQGQHHR